MTDESDRQLLKAAGRALLARDEAIDPIPEEVVDALYAARETAQSNMFARGAVMKVISDLDDYPAAVLWLYENERRYIEAMNAMGERLAAERGA